jgi:hypothetical protein
MKLINDLGLLRASLLGLAIFDTLLRPEPGSYPIYDGWGAVPTLVVPAAIPIIIMVILFDALMSKIRSNDAETEQGRLKYRNIMRAELGVVLITSILWAPYFMAIGK